MSDVVCVFVLVCVCLCFCVCVFSKLVVCVNVRACLLGLCCRSSVMRLILYVHVLFRMYCNAILYAYGLYVFACVLLFVCSRVSV